MIGLVFKPFQGLFAVALVKRLFQSLSLLLQQFIRHSALQGMRFVSCATLFASLPSGWPQNRINTRPLGLIRHAPPATFQPLNTAVAGASLGGRQAFLFLSSPRWGLAAGLTCFVLVLSHMFLLGSARYADGPQRGTQLPAPPPRTGGRGGENSRPWAVCFPSVF
jgi:hypothetical protein